MQEEKQSVGATGEQGTLHPPMERISRHHDHNQSIQRSTRNFNPPNAARSNHDRTTGSCAAASSRCAVDISGVLRVPMVKRTNRACRARSSRARASFSHASWQPGGMGSSACTHTISRSSSSRNGERGPEESRSTSMPRNMKGQ